MKISAKNVVIDYPFYDIVHGAATVISAMGDGEAAAKATHKYLREYK